MENMIQKNNSELIEILKFISQSSSAALLANENGKDIKLKYIAEKAYQAICKYEVK